MTGTDKLREVVGIVTAEWLLTTSHNAGTTQCSLKPVEYLLRTHKRKNFFT